VEISIFRNTCKALLLLHHTNRKFSSKKISFGDPYDEKNFSDRNNSLARVVGLVETLESVMMISSWLVCGVHEVFALKFLG